MQTGCWWYDSDQNLICSSLTMHSILIGFNSLGKTVVGLPLFNGSSIASVSCFRFHFFLSWSILKRSKFIPTKCQKCNIRLVSLNLILSPKHLLSWLFFFRSISWFQICFDDFQHYRKQKILCIEPERITTNEKKLRYFSLVIPTVLPLFFSAWKFPLNSMVNGRKKNCTCPFFSLFSSNFDCRKIGTHSIWR